MASKENDNKKSAAGDTKSTEITPLDLDDRFVRWLLAYSHPESHYFEFSNGKQTVSFRTFIKFPGYYYGDVEESVRYWLKKKCIMVHYANITQLTLSEPESSKPNESAVKIPIFSHGIRVYGNIKCELFVNSLDNPVSMECGDGDDMRLVKTSFDPRGEFLKSIGKKLLV